jgi:P4 family phage/plasmid primase-like protien
MKSIKESSFTHTSISDPPGSFYIQSEDMATFFDLYKTALENKCELYLTEKHRDIAPILIDFDFRFKVSEDEIERKYSYEMIKNCISIYISELKKFITINDRINIMLMEKSTPVHDKKKDIIKDGIHIVIPDIVTRKSVQLIVRQRTLKKIGNILQAMNCENNVNDIFDEAVIAKNNWQMYGSKKPNSEAYVVTNHWEYNIDENNFMDKDLIDDKEYVEILSIRNKFVENELTQENIEEVYKLDKSLKDNDVKKERKKQLFEKIVQNHETCFTPTTCEELGLVKNLLGILNHERAHNYGDWIRLGWCLRNIDINLLSDWDEFSKISKKYEVGYCDKIWYFMKEGGLGLGTLHMWAKKDNQAEYEKLISKDISYLIYKSLSETDYDIAVVISRMFKHRYRCASHKHHIWYEYKDHRWKEIEKGYTLFYKEIPTLLFDEYHKMNQIESQKALCSTDETVKTIAGRNCETLTKIARKLKNTNFVKDKMYKECSGMFYEPKFEEKLDANPTLIGFENGVYDLETAEFREGRPEDYISLTTGINYIEYDPENPYIYQVSDFMNKVLTNEDVREYVMILFASMLDGNNRDEKFHIWTGSGSNGKSKIVELFQYAIGEYACIFNVSLLTQKRVGSNGTNSELAIAKGKRFAILQEPEENERLNVGLMKELTGGDKIQCRCLFKEPIKFKPMFKMILTCNHMPAIPPDDGGTWRRIRRVEFTSKFVDSPNKDENSNEFKIDRELSHKFTLWKETFMIMLLHKYKKYKKLGKIVEPKEVLDYTSEYQRKNDIFADFCDTYIKNEPGGVVPVATLFAIFKEYCTVDNIKNKGIKKAIFQEALEKRYGFVINMGGSKGKCWKGIEIVPQKTINNNLEEIDEDDKC